MRSLFLVLLFPAVVAAAGMNVTYLVPAYTPCSGGQTSCVPVKESTFTFDQVILKSSQSPYTLPNKLSLVIILKGVRDAAGELVTTDPNNPDDDFVVNLSPGRTVLVAQGLQLEPGSPLLPRLSIRIDLTDGKGKVPYRTPAETPTSGFVSESTETPSVLDNQGKRFAVAGARSKN